MVTRVNFYKGVKSENPNNTLTSQRVNGTSIGKQSVQSVNIIKKFSFICNIFAIFKSITKQYNYMSILK